MLEAQQCQEDSNDFFSNFFKFHQTAKDVTNVRFSYMKELYNLGIETFPDNQEIFNIQQNNKLSSQANFNKLKKNWTDDDKKVLIWIVGKLMAINKRDLKQISDADWKTISQMMQRRDAFQCKQKWLQMMKLPLQQAPWNQMEDEMLRQIIDDFQKSNKGNKWSQIATTLNKISDQHVHRNGKQCRERWNNHLNPTINRNPWQLAEDLDLLRLSILNGKKWALISKKLIVPRSENSVKNRFNCLLRKERNQKLCKRDDYSQIEDESKCSNFPSAEELSHSDIKHIQVIIRKLEWRIQQDGSQNSEEEEQEHSIVKQEHQELVKKVKIEAKPQIKKEIKPKNENQTQIQKSQESLLTNSITLQVKDCSGLTKEELLKFTPCLLNSEKNQIYFVNPEQLQNYVNSKNQEFGEALSIPSNSHPAMQLDQKMFRSFVAYQQQYQQQQQEIQNMYNIHAFQTQRSQLNLPQSIPNYQSFQNYSSMSVHNFQNQGYPSNQHLQMFNQFYQLQKMTQSQSIQAQTPTQSQANDII